MPNTPQTPLEAAFPSRPLTLTRRFLVSSVWELAACALLCGVAGLGLLFYTAPEILRDAWIGDAYRLDDSVAVEGSCSQDLILATCSLRLTAKDGAEHTPFFFYLRVGHPANIDTRGGVADDGSLVVSAAQHSVLSRSVTLSGLVGFCVAMVALCWVVSKRRRALLRAANAMRNAPLKPVEVEIVRMFGGGGAALEFSYRPRVGGRLLWVAFPGDFELFTTGLAIEPRPAGDDRPAIGRPMALAARPAAGGVAIPLDRELTSLDLTEDEREAIDRALGT